MGNEKPSVIGGEERRKKRKEGEEPPLFGVPTEKPTILDPEVLQKMSGVDLDGEAIVGENPGVMAPGEFLVDPKSEGGPKKLKEIQDWAKLSGKTVFKRERIHIDPATIEGGGGAIYDVYAVTPELPVKETYEQIRARIYPSSPLLPVMIGLSRKPSVVVHKPPKKTE